MTKVRICLVSQDGGQRMGVSVEAAWRRPIVFVTLGTLFVGERRLHMPRPSGN